MKNRYIKASHRGFCNETSIYCGSPAQAEKRQLKHCYRCQRRLPLAAFHHDYSRRDGRRNLCKECAREKFAAYYAANRELICERMAASMWIRRRAAHDAAATPPAGTPGIRSDGGR